jgi:hypothetical protein
MESYTGVVESVTIAAASAVENLVKFKWTEAAKALFSVRKAQAATLKAENAAPGSQLAYLVNAERKLANG